MTGTDPTKSLRVAIIGCGKIADQHVAACRRTGRGTVVGLCDREPLMAQQLGERFGIDACYGEAAELLRRTAPDVVHITTPPQSHFTLGRLCLEAGCHVYLEKPFTVTAREAEDLIQMAQQNGRHITAGHNLQFTLEMLEMRRLVAAGFLGGRPAHLESHFSYGLNDANYVGPLLGNRQHWVRQLPGQLLHNVISHGIAKLSEFLDDELDLVLATAHQSPQLRKLGGAEMLDELRVLIRDRAGTTAFFCFSTQIKPGLNRLQIRGPTNSLTVDHSSGSLVRHWDRACKSYLTYWLPPLREAREHFRNARMNFFNFLSGRLHQDAGMKELVDRFYQAIQQGGALPIPYREIRLTARIMDEIFAQIYPASTAEARPGASATPPS